MLEQTGYTCLRAYSGTEAVTLLERERPDLILLDLMLPGLSGEEVLKKIAGIPVIVVSAKAGVDDKVALLLGGAQDYITKPFSTKELLARVEVQLRKTGTAPQSGAGEIVLNPLSHCSLLLSWYIGRISHHPYQHNRQLAHILHPFSTFYPVPLACHNAQGALISSW